MIQERGKSIGDECRRVLVAGNKEDPRDIARVGLDGVEAGALTVATDKMAIDSMAAHAADPERFERQLAKLLHVTQLRAPE